MRPLYAGMGGNKGTYAGAWEMYWDICGGLGANKAKDINILENNSVSVGPGDMGPICPHSGPYTHTGAHVSTQGPIDTHAGAPIPTQGPMHLPTQGPIPTQGLIHPHKALYTHTLYTHTRGQSIHTGA